MTTPTEKQLIALGYKPKTWRGWWFWLRFWRPKTTVWKKPGR